MGGEIDPTGQRRAALERFLAAKVGEGYEIETHTDTHAIVSRPRSLLRRLAGGAADRYVASVDEHSEVTMIPAEPKRS